MSISTLLAEAALLPIRVRLLPVAALLGLLRLPPRNLLTARLLLVATRRRLDPGRLLAARWQPGLLFIPWLRIALLKG